MQTAEDHFIYIKPSLTQTDCVSTELNAAHVAYIHDALAKFILVTVSSIRTAVVSYAAQAGDTALV